MNTQEQWSSHMSPVSRRCSVSCNLTSVCPQAHKLFSKLQWVGAAVAVFAAAFAAFSFGSGAPLKKLIAPTVLAAIAGALGALARDYREKLEFVDYRCVLLN